MLGRLRLFTVLDGWRGFAPHFLPIVRALALRHLSSAASWVLWVNHFSNGGAARRLFGFARRREGAEGLRPTFSFGVYIFCEYAC